MATIPFLGVGEPIEAFNIDNVLVNKEMLPGEVRLRTAFPYPTLEMWRRQGMQFTAVSPTTGSSDIATRGRTLVLFAHDADLKSIFFDLTGADDVSIAGWYVDKLKAQAVDKILETAMTQRAQALRELKQLLVPDQHIELIRSRLEGPSFNHRVAGLCAAVYLTALLLSEANK